MATAFVVALCLVALAAGVQGYKAPSGGGGGSYVPVTASPPPSCPTAWDVIQATPSLAAVRNALQASGLNAAVSDKSFAGTLFLPTSDAVATCFKIGCLNSNTLLYHIVGGQGLSSLALFSTGNPTSWIMMNGGATTAKLAAAGSVTISSATNTANVIYANIQFCKGYIHIIDTVLNPAPAAPAASPSPPPSPTNIPPSPPACSPSAYDMIASTPALAGFRSLIDRTGRRAYFQNPLLVATIFAPVTAWVAPPGVDEGYAVDTMVVPGQMVMYPTPLAGTTFVSRSGRQYMVSYDGPATAPVNLRVNASTPTQAAFLDPANINRRACQFVIHHVGVILWPNAGVTGK